MKKIAFFLFLLLCICEISLSNVQCATYVQSERDIQIINDDIELERDTQYDNYMQPDASLQFLSFPEGYNYTNTFEEKPEINAQCVITDIEYNSTYYRVLEVSNLESESSVIQFKTSFESMDLTFGAMFSFKDVLNAKNLTIRIAIIDSFYEDYQLDFLIDTNKVAVRIRSYSSLDDKLSSYSDYLDIANNQRITILRSNSSTTTTLLLFVDNDYAQIQYASRSEFTPTDLYIINENVVYSNYYFYAFTAIFNPQPAKGLKNLQSFDYIDASDIQSEYNAKRSIFNQDVLEFENPFNETYELVESSTFRNPDSPSAVITDALYFSDFTQFITWNYGDLAIGDSLYINIFKESLLDYYTEMDVLIGNSINYIEYNVRIDEIKISKYEYDVKTSLLNISLTEDPQNFVLGISRISFSNISLLLLGKYSDVLIIPPAEKQFNYIESLDNFITVKAKYSHVPIAFYVSRIGLIYIDDIYDIFEGNFGISLFESSDSFDFELARPIYPNYYESNYRIPKIEFMLIDVQYNSSTISEVHSFSFEYNNEEYVFNEDELIEDPYVYDTNVFEYTLDSFLSAFIVSDDSIITANYTMNSTFTFLYQISEIPDEFLESMVSAITPLLMYLIIPILFYSRFGKKGAMFGLILSVFVNMFVGTIPIFYNIIILIVSIVLVIAMLKSNKNNEDDN